MSECWVVRWSKMMVRTWIRVLSDATIHPHPLLLIPPLASSGCVSVIHDLPAGRRMSRVVA